MADEIKSYMTQAIPEMVMIHPFPEKQTMPMAICEVRQREYIPPHRELSTSSFILHHKNLTVTKSHHYTTLL
jgi:hypothetical protein